MFICNAPLFVHSDTARGLIAAKRAGAKVDARDLHKSLLIFLEQQVEGGRQNLLFPAFNYDYGAARVFDVDKDPIQVGALAEWLRQSNQMVRSAVPFFSFLSTRDLALDASGTLNPFGQKSGFQWLVDHDATLLLFGAPTNSLTFIHYVEEMSGGPVYRYRKQFPGQIMQNGVARDVEFMMHVRPQGAALEYDWKRIETDLSAEGILIQADYSQNMKWLNARKLKHFWSDRLVQDPFYLLDAASRTYFEGITNGGRQRVRQEDFEDV
ncbi:MAG: AAC(3) family N-acetyltransferase [Roseobacter sp.]